MSEKKEELIDLILNRNVSAIQILSDKLEVTSDEVIELIQELVEEGSLDGSLTADSKRFFKREVKLSHAPAIEREEKPPDFMSFNARPAIATTIVGFLIIAAGVIVNALALDIVEQNFAAVLIFVGLLVTMIGLYSISRRKTPS